MTTTKADRILFLLAQGYPRAVVAEVCQCGPAYIRAVVQRDRCGGSRPCDLLASQRQHQRYINRTRMKQAA